MTSRQDYTEDEWQLLLDTPLMIGAAVMVVGKSGLGTMKESFTLAQETLGALKSFPDNSLIQGLLESRFKDKQKASIESFSHPMLKLQPQEFKDAVVEKCRLASSVLKAKSDSTEAAQYLQWCDEIADSVANAASEGGILGFGGTRFSDEEKTAIAEIRSALNIA